MSDDAKDKGEKPKILIDSDWKEQAAKEKEQLAGGPDELADDAGDLPEANFLQHCASLATQAMIFLGAIANPVTGQAEYHPEQARYLIDTLVMLKEKTAGNLTKEEDNALQNLTAELKFAWVQITTSRGGGKQPEN